jgi:acetamidase/formamidase
MQTFPRERVREHCVEAEWPDFLGSVSLGESFVVETERFNAANGPIEVRGVSAGDAIAVHIEKIDIVEPYEAPNGGPFVEGIGPPVPLEFRDGYFYFPQGLRLKAQPSVGNIAVLPYPDDDMLGLSRRSLAADSRHLPFRGWRRVVNDPRGKHCHQDCSSIREGAIVHLKAQVGGAGVCAADVHGYIGEGEMAFAGIEVAADVRLRVEQSSGWLVDWPLIETEDEIMVFCSHTDTFPDRAHQWYVDVVREAYRAMRAVVAARMGGTIDESNAIVASAVDIRNCALYGLQRFVPGDKRTQDGDIAVVAALPKDIFYR